MSKQSSLKTVYTSWSGYHFCGDPATFVAQIMNYVNSLPKGAQDVHLEISTEPDYDSDRAVIDVSYKIPYTEEEMAKIQQDAINSIALAKAKKLELYNQLKKEFE